MLTSSVEILCKNVVIFPSRTAAIENALHLFSPHLAVVDEHLTRHLPRQWLTSLALEVYGIVMPFSFCFSCFSKWHILFATIISATFRTWFCWVPVSFCQMSKKCSYVHVCPCCEIFAKARIISGKFFRWGALLRKKCNCMHVYPFFEGLFLVGWLVGFSFMKQAFLGRNNFG